MSDVNALREVDEVIQAGGPTRLERTDMLARTWLITGVSSGFGRELTTQPLERGNRVAGNVRRPERSPTSSNATRTRSEPSCST